MKATRWRSHVIIPKDNKMIFPRSVFTDISCNDLTTSRPPPMTWSKIIFFLFPSHAYQHIQWAFAPCVEASTFVMSPCSFIHIHICALNSLYSFTTNTKVWHLHTQWIRQGPQTDPQHFEMFNLCAHLYIVRLFTDKIVKSSTSDGVNGWKHSKSKTVYTIIHLIAFINRETSLKPSGMNKI